MILNFLDMKRFYCFLITLFVLAVIMLAIKFPVFAQAATAVLTFLLTLLILAIVYPLIERRDD